MRKLILWVLGLAVLLAGCDFLQAPPRVSAIFDPPSLTVAPGGTLTATLRFQAENFQGQASLRLTDPAGFTLLEPTGVVEVRDGSQVTVRVEVGQVDPGTYTLNFLLQPQGLDPVNVPLRVTVELPPSVEGSFEPSSLTARPGETVSTTLNLSATNYTGQATLSLQGPAGFTLASPQGSFAVRDGSQVTVRVEVGQVDPGTYTLNFLLQPQGLDPVNVPLRVTVELPPSVEGSFEPSSLTARPGETVSTTLNLSATNYTGQATLSLQGPAGFTLASPQGSFAVRDGSQVTVRVEVGQVDPGTYTLNFLLQPQGLDPVDLTLNVVVQEPLRGVRVTAPSSLDLVVGDSTPLTLQVANDNSVSVTVEATVVDTSGLSVSPLYQEVAVGPRGSASISFSARAASAGSGTVSVLVKTVVDGVRIASETVSVPWSAQARTVSFTASPASGFVSDDPPSPVTSQVAYTASGGAGGVVAFEVTTPGWTVQPTFVNISGSTGTFTLQLTPPSGIAAGSHNVQIVAHGNGFDSSFAVPVTLSTINVSLASTSLEANPTATLQGTISPVGAVPEETTFALSLEGDDAGSFAISPTTARLGDFSTTLFPVPGTPAGTYSLVLKVSAPGLTRRVPFQVVLTPRDYTASLSPASFSVYQGETTDATLTIAPQGGYSGTLVLAVRDATTGSLVSWATVTPGSVDVNGPASYPVSLNVSADAPTGTHNLVLTLYGEVTKDVPFVLAVDQATFDISLSKTSFNIPAESSDIAVLYLILHGAFSGSISLSLQGPGASDFALAPSSIDTSAETWAIYLTNTSASSGTYNLTLVATSGSVVRQVPITVNVP